VQRALLGSALSAHRRASDDRRSVRGSASIKSRHGTLRTETVDISEHGVCLSSRGPLDVSATYQLHLKISDEQPRKTVVLARVCL